MGRSWPGEGRGNSAPSTRTAGTQAWVAWTRVVEGGWSAGREGERAASDSRPGLRAPPLRALLSTSTKVGAFEIKGMETICQL